MLADIAAAQLEDWFRDRYFDAAVDISCSGLPPCSLGELRRLLGLEWKELDAVVFRDSPSLGGERLRRAVAERFAGGQVQRVMATNGSSEAIFLALAALVHPGDEVVVLRPAYQSLYSIAEALDARLRFWDLPAHDDFRPDLRQLADMLRRGTRVVVVNFPHNPTGATLAADQYRDLVELVAAHGCYLLWDAAFAELTHDAPPLPEPALELERCVSTGTLSKTYGLPGLRAGWCIAPPALLSEMVRIRDYLTLNVSPLVEVIAAAVLERADVLLRRHLDLARAGRSVLVDWADAHPDLVSLPLPKGGVTGFPALLGYEDTAQLAARLSDRHGVLVVPGGCFGHPDRLRIGFGVAADELRGGLQVLDELVVGAGARSWTS